ncbi:MAG TPA: Crp/Fnr family transcriptional regulator [Devosia sp.]|nr:Crp/Fnr family transcriptional regulator [Devosia sp.]
MGGFELSPVELVGYGGTVLTALSYSMRTIVPLRVAGIASSAFFIVYGVFIGSLPMLATELIILPLNVMRLVQILRLMKQVENASGGEFDIAWLESFAQIRPMNAGHVLFHAGDEAKELYVVHNGRFGLEGRNDVTFGPGDMMGELGFLSPDNKRTATLVCLEEGEVGAVSYFDLKQLYFQNPKFGFYLLKLIAGRLFQNEARARAAAAPPLALEAAQ